VPTLVDRQQDSNLSFLRQLNCVPSQSTIHTWVKENKSIGPNEIDSASTSFAAQEEDEFLPFRVVELVNELLSLCDAASEWSRPTKDQTYFFSRQSFSKRSSV
jgi:hypothetical protein